MVRAMKAILLNGDKGGPRSTGTAGAVKRGLTEKLGGSGWDVEVIELSEKNIGGCLGCFGCWVRTPGLCVQNDDGSDIIKAVIRSDLTIFLTPVAFGGYSSELKKAVDRFICLGLPYFIRVKGEIRHPKRYDRYPDFAVIGILPHPDDEMAATFKGLYARNMLNARPNRSALSMIAEGAGTSMVEVEIGKLLKNVGAIA
jgi:multimeric flavodoxin WrbA